MPRKAPVEPPPPPPEISAAEQQKQLLIENWSIHRVPDLEPERAVVHRIARDAVCTLLTSNVGGSVSLIVCSARKVRG